MKKTIKINENYIFRRMYRVGKSSVSPVVALYYKKNNKKFNRLGITVTKKIGNAVKRNRARRITQEAYRLLENDLPTGYDIVIVCRAKAVFVKMQVVKQSLQQLFSKI